MEGTIGRANELQMLVNQEARATTGCFRRTNLGALSMEAGLRAATAQLENRQRRFGLRLLSLPEGDQAREVVGAPTEIGRRLKSALAYVGQTERTVLCGRGATWAGVKGHMGSNQEAYDAECAALARALEAASRRNTTPERVTICTDAKAAIRRMAADEPGPGQQYALQARKHIAALRRARPGIVIKTRWCPAHKGVAGNEKADEWAKTVAEEPDARGVEWLSYSDRNEARVMPRPRSLASSGRSLRKSGWRRASGLEAEPPRQNTECRKRRGQMARLPGAPKGVRIMGVRR